MTKVMNFEALQANLRMLDKKSEMAFEKARANGTLTKEQEKFSSLMSDEAFLERFFAADSAEDVQALFKENGLDFSIEEINAFGKRLSESGKKLIDNGGEITEEELELVAGGVLGLSEKEETAAFTMGTLGVGTGAAVGGYYGAALGTMILPGAGSIIGGFIGGFIGFAGGMTGGGAAGFFGTAGAIKGAKKLGKWIKSWF